MLITDDGLLPPLVPGIGYRTIMIPDAPRTALNIFPQQKLYAYPYKESGQLLLATIPLKPPTCLYRVTLTNIEGALAEAAKIFAENEVNLSISEDVRIGHIAVWEVLADFSKAKKAKKELDKTLRASQYITAVYSEKLTMIFPDIKFLEDPPELITEWDAPTGMIRIAIPIDMLTKDLGIDWNEESRIILTAYSRVPLFSIQFLPPGTPLVRIDAHLKDEPKTLSNAANVLREFVDLRASIATTPILGEKCPWRAYGILRKGKIFQVKQLLEGTYGVISPVAILPLGWTE